MGIAYRISLCQNRRYISLPGGIRTHYPYVTDKTILPPSVTIERCLSRPNRTICSGTMNKIMKSLGTCLWHLPRGQHHRITKQILSPYGGHRANKFELNPFIGLAYNFVKRFLQGFARSHMARATCNRLVWNRHYCLSAVPGNRTNIHPSRSAEPLVLQMRKCLDRQT